jgi:2,4-dienoyl-CoA reductase (NADPH2)
MQVVALLEVSSVWSALRVVGSTPYPHLFAPGAIGAVEIRNRIVQSPMGTGFVEMGRVTDRDIAVQEERARGGVGLIVTGGTVVHETSRFPVRIILEAWDEDGIPALARRVEAVHRHGARIFGQLVHLGRESPGGMTESVPMGPSPIPTPRDPAPPHELGTEEIRMLVDAFAGRRRTSRRRATTASSCTPPTGT